MIAPFDGAPRLPTLAGARLGLIDDSKRNADGLLAELSEILAPGTKLPASSGIASPAPRAPADPAALAALAQDCDAVVIAIGD